MSRSRALSAAEARRIALVAQGFGGPRPDGPPTRRQLARMVGLLSALQIDSVNVLVRAHYLPLFARLGPYDPGFLAGAAYAGRRRTLFEYWGHEASLLPVSLHPLFRWRMARAAQGRGIYGGLASFARRHRPFVERVLAEVRARGPLSAAELTDGGRARGPWWGWSNGKRALEWLFWTGQVTTATRRRFERVYDVPERALPRAVVEAPTPPEDVAQRALVRRAARALGVATERDLRDYFRLDAADTRRAVAALVEGGELAPVSVEGWTAPAYLDPGVRAPARLAARALVSPFDSLVWDRHRTERVFGFHYRIALYTPVAQRRHGYYVLPFLLGDRLVARVDLKADRAAGALLVLAGHAEAGVRAAEVAGPLAEELRVMAGWLGVARVHVRTRGALGAALRAALRGADSLGRGGGRGGD